MSLRKDPRRPRRQYHGFPWSTKAVAAAVSLWTIPDREPTLPRPSLRAIAAELHNRGLVQHLPDPATLRRLLSRESVRSTYGKNGPGELAAIGGGR
jgi:hypothetical protein